MSTITRTLVFAVLLVTGAGILGPTAVQAQELHLAMPKSRTPEELQREREAALRRQRERQLAEAVREKPALVQREVARPLLASDITPDMLQQWRRDARTTSERLRRTMAEHCAAKGQRPPCSLPVTRQ